MTKTKKTIMWSSIACLCALAIAGTTVGVTYARYTTSDTGSGAAAVAYWDVAVTPTDSTEITIYASPSAEEYSDAPRTSKSDLQLAAYIVNSGDVAATVTVTQSGTLGFTLREGAKVTQSDAEAYLTAEVLAAHFTVELYQATTAGGDTATLGGPIELAAATVSEGTRIPTEAYIYCDLLWTTDVDGLTGADADAFDTYVGTNVESITFGLSYTASQSTSN